LTVGYVHSTMTTFPSYIIHRPGAPAKLMIHGTAYQRSLVEDCGWAPDAVHMIDSCRFARRGAALGGKVFLPYFFSDADHIVAEITTLIRSLPGPVQPLKVQIHPDFVSDPAHMQLQQRLEKVLAAQPQAFSEGGDVIAIHVGITSAVLEALENGVTVFHVVEDPTLDAYSSEIWPELVTRRISNHSYSYTLAVAGAFIRFAQAGKGTFLPQLAPLIAQWGKET